MAWAHFKNAVYYLRIKLSGSDKNDYLTFIQLNFC